MISARVEKTLNPSRVENDLQVYLHALGENSFRLIRRNRVIE